MVSDDANIFSSESMIPYWICQSHRIIQDKALPQAQHTVTLVLQFPEQGSRDLFEVLKERDILLHHPFNSMEPVLELLEKAANDPYVLSIKITIYRLAKESRISAALLKAAENGKHVSVYLR